MTKGSVQEKDITIINIYAPNIRAPRQHIWASLVAQRLKHLPPMRETWVRSLGQEDPLEKEMANPLQYSCLENPMEGGVW